ncbi:MAG: response regulator transcription factor [Rhodospirillales bacterium]|nr:response regulator transcription factor [Alphaproteobacteria bacterium]MCB1840973.1 response regulator transcription factor [Alphaproteobacteria bacterium]MCB9976175.1 response regulator transcription factor [Rhodospirillales bacterium]
MKLLIADDHTLFRDTLVQYIERAYPGAHVSLAKDFHETRKILADECDYDLVVLDFRMPGMNGFEGLKFIREKYPDKPVAIMSGVAEPEDVKTSIEMGASGYFPKTLSGKSLLSGIRQVLSGKPFVPLDDNHSGYAPSYYNDPKPAQTISNNNTDEKSPEDLKKIMEDLGLTPRERQIVAFLAKGTTNQEIADALGLKIVTVKLHVRSICRKLGVKNRTQAALKLRDSGISSETLQT